MEKAMQIKLAAGIVLVVAFAALAITGATFDQQAYDRKENVTVTNDEGVALSVDVFYPRGFTLSGTYPAIIVSHGDMTTKDVMSFFSLELVNRGWVVVAYDFRNHGQSGNINGGIGTVDDTRAVFEHVWNHMSFVNKTQIGLLGHSRGGITSMQLSDFVAGNLAATVNIAGPAEDVTLNTTQPRNLLVIAGNEDVNVPPSETLEILVNATGGGTGIDVLYGNFAAGTARKLHYVDGGHTKILFTKETYVEAITWFEHAFYGSLRSPVSPAFETRLAIMVATASIAIACFFWAMFAIHQALVAKQIIVHEPPTSTNNVADIGRRMPSKKLLPLKMIIVTAIIGGAGGGIMYLLLKYRIGTGYVLGFFDYVPVTPFVYWGIVPLMVVGAIGLVLRAFLCLMDKQRSRKGSKVINSALITQTKGKGLVNLGLGIGMFVLLYYLASILATPLYDTRINPNRFPLFFYLVLLLFLPSLASSLLTFDGIQSKFNTNHFQDVWVTLAIGIVGRGIVVGALIIFRTIYFESLVFFIVFMAADLFFSMVSFHYFRSALQEAMFNSLLLAWVLTCLGNILIL